MEDDLVEIECKLNAVQLAWIRATWGVSRVSPEAPKGITAQLVRHGLAYKPNSLREEYWLTELGLRLRERLLSQ